jgi:hypothetical protein
MLVLAGQVSTKLKRGASSFAASKLGAFKSALEKAAGLTTHTLYAPRFSILDLTVSAAI